jgi:uncharacterized cofD-like protein
MSAEALPKVVAIGGGSGLSVLLRGLKKAVGREVGDLKAVVTVSDDGGSSGRLRRDFGVLPPGDIRNCLVALADDEDLLARLFQYRFAGGDGLSGHSFGNLLLTALTGITGDFYTAVLTAEEILAVRGKILPATLSDVRLTARGRSGSRYEGESAIGAAGEALESIALRPSRPPAFADAVEAIRAADLLVLGPGSLYTSLLPNLLIPGIRDAIRGAAAPVVLPMNLMTQPGETDGMSAIEHLEALAAHAGGNLVDVVLANSEALPEPRLEPYTEVQAQPVAVDRNALEASDVEVVEVDLLAPGGLIRHDPEKLSRAVIALLERRRER